MKVLQINGVCRTGSTGKIVTGIENALIKSGNESIIAYSGNHELLQDSRYFRVGSRFSTRIHQLLGLLLGDAGFHSTLQTKRLIKYIEEEKPDIVHLHNIYSYYLNIEVLLRFLSKNGINTVITIHDCWLLTGHCTHFYSVNCNKWKTGCCNCPLIREYPSSLFLDKSANLYKRKKDLYCEFNDISVVCVSNWIKSIVDASILGQFSSSVIYNGVDINRIETVKNIDMKTQLGIKDRFVILGVSNGWGKNKGLDDFIKLSELISDDMCIILVGLTSTQISSLPDNIIGISKTNNYDELINYYRSSDVFVSFSKQETMGLVVVEAMSCGLPAIVMPTTASPELVSEGVGYVNASSTEQECLKWINVVRENGKESYSEACKDRVYNMFSASRNYQRYVELYNEIIDRRKSLY